MSFISSFDIISVVLFDKAKSKGCLPNSKIFYVFLHLLLVLLQLILREPKHLANGLITFFIEVNPVFSIGPRSLPRNPPDCIILDNCVFDKLISVDDYLVKALWRLVNNNLWGESVSSSPSIFDNNLKTTPVSFFIEDFNLLSCENDSFTFKVLYCVILYW